MMIKNGLCTAILSVYINGCQSVSLVSHIPKLNLYQQKILFYILWTTAIFGHD